jgi:GTPase SAR1 family protein
MVATIFIVGLAGSGKSLLSYSLWEWFSKEKQDIAVLNLDPGVINTPYNPDFDIREYINIWELMEKHNVGPNTALIVSMDLALAYIEKINLEIGKHNPDILIVDTPGQMEIFAYRVVGDYIVSNLAGDKKMLLFLLDGVFCKDPKNFISNLLVAASTRYRFQIPTLNILNKIDLLEKEALLKLYSWYRDPDRLLREMEMHYDTYEAEMMRKMFKLLRKYSMGDVFLPVSAETLHNFDILVQAITRILFGGEEILR